MDRPPCHAHGCVSGDWVRDMPMTEEEAAARRCCGPDGCGDLRAPRSHPHEIPRRYCIASTCMAWRWVDRVCKHKKHGTLHDASVMNDGFSDAAEYELLPQRGFCGLAGAP